MTRFQTRLAEVCSRLNRVGSSYVLVGATAMQLWGTTRMAREIDLLIEPDVENARRILEALRDAGLRLAGGWLAREVVSRPVTIIGGPFRVAVLTAAASLRYVDARGGVRVFEVEDVMVPVASIDDLIASKRTGLARDEADIETLEEIRRARAS